MSLINDALRRARQAQQDSPPVDPTPVAQLRPVEPAPRPPRRGPGLLLPISLGLTAVLALLLLWQLSTRGPGRGSLPATAPLNVAARPLAPEPAAAVEIPVAAPVSAAADRTAQAGATTAEAPIHSAEHVNPSAATNLAVSAATTNLSGETPAPSTPPAEPAPAPLKLQGIVYNPRRPSAMINGRIVFVGDRIRDLRVAAIHAGEVVLMGAGRTNLLSLDP